MSATAAVPADAASLLRPHREALARLPVTVRAFLALEAERWPAFFPPEKAHLMALLEALAGPGDPDLAGALAAVARVEADAGCGQVRESDPRRLQEATQSVLRRKGLLPRWRREVDAVFRVVQPRIEARLHPAGSPRRLVVVVYGKGIAIQRDRLWARLRGAGTRIALHLDGAAAPAPFLRALFTAGGQTLFSAAAIAPRDAWAVDAGDALAGLCEGAGATALSYARLGAYRETLARTLYQKVTSGVSGPQELAAFARALAAAPPQGALLHADEVVRGFVRDVFLGGNGALLVSNTFVEWAAVQAIKRAEPRLLVARFGVREKMKPFSSLLLFSSPRPTDQVPVLEDPFGSFVDAEQLAYYVWLNAEKSAAYRGRTLYLFLAEGVDEMLAIRSDRPPDRQDLPTASLAEVAATMAGWLGLATGDGAARPITALAG